MPARIQPIVERSVKAEVPKAITLVAKTSTTILPDLNVQQIPNVNTDWGFEIAGRFIFNDSAAKLYYAIGVDKCDNVNAYHGAIADQGLLDCTPFGGQLVSVYSVAGGNVSVIILHRQDLFGHRAVQNEFPAQQT